MVRCACEYNVLPYQLKEKMAGLEKNLADAESEKTSLMHQLTEKQGQVREQGLGSWGARTGVVGSKDWGRGEQGLGSWGARTGVVGSKDWGHGEQGLGSWGARTGGCGEQGLGSWGARTGGRGEVD